MTRLSVNLNKVALIRNARGGNIPDLIEVAKDCERFGAEGITVHPRPDQRHVRYDDLAPLKEIVTTEFNIEGNPTSEFLNIVCEIKPHQCTLVPDAPDALTSDAGWNTLKNHDFLQEVIQTLKENGIRTSLFIDPDEKMLDGARKVETDRIEFYTGPYAHDFARDPESAVESFARASRHANTLGLGVNAGHDLNLLNLRFFNQHLPNLLEVSIGHALISDALYYGLQNVIQMYKDRLRD
ncbi:MAG: pyridoxine 5'-phosphate synthase [Saprospiraceae bacterium]|nr:pyridoxine 5'-phosphate synthase [Saprospiraceae bacterium]